MAHYSVLPKILGASALSLAFIALPLSAQNASAESSSSGTANTTSSAGASSASDNAQTRSSGGSATSQVNEQDREFMEDIAHANFAEIETGKMALEKSQDAQIKKFAQMMIDDHTKAMDELQKLAKSKGVTLPTETDIQHKAIATALQALSGNAFDEQYIARVGVGDHQRTLELLQNTQKQAKDKELMAYAAKTVKSVTMHLDHAKKLEKKK